MTAQTHDLVVILDFGAQYSQLIARRVRECNVYSEILPFDTPIEELKKRNVKAVILSGGPSSVYDKNAPHPDKKIWDSGIPMLGICYGVQLMAENLGGQVSPGSKKEYGKTELLIDDNSDLFAGLLTMMDCWMSHGDKVSALPKGFKRLAHTQNTEFAAVGNPEKKIYGVQFHPEVVHTPKGIEIIKNFIYIISDVKPTWTTKNFIEMSVNRSGRPSARKKYSLRCRAASIQRPLPPW